MLGCSPARSGGKNFVNDHDGGKRAKLVDELLDRREFVDMWVMKWAEVLKIRSSDNQRVSYKATLLYFNWLEQEDSGQRSL